MFRDFCVWHPSLKNRETTFCEDMREIKKADENIRHKSGAKHHRLDLSLLNGPNGVPLMIFNSQENRLAHFVSGGCADGKMRQTFSAFLNFLISPISGEVFSGGTVWL